MYVFKQYVNFAIHIRFIPSVIKVNMTQYMPVYNVHPLANNWNIAAKTKQTRNQDKEVRVSKENAKTEVIIRVAQGSSGTADMAAPSAFKQPNFHRKNYSFYQETFLVSITNSCSPKEKVHFKRETVGRIYKLL